MDAHLPIQFDRLCDEILTLIEIEEAKLLNWGFFDVRSDLEVNLPALLQKLPPAFHPAWEDAQAKGYTIAKVIDNLKIRKLIFHFTVAGHSFYRSRFAETIRLLCLLRQRFSFEDWQTASRLVSDIKIQLQRRRYPRRDINPDTLLQALRTAQATPRYQEVMESLLYDKPEVPLKLARFQQEAILQQVLHLQSHATHALVVGAGTGSGKTKTFYVPALAEIASTLSNERRVQAIALYPRVELLKDQLCEAFAEINKLNAYLRKHRLRNIVIGAYYGDTPTTAPQFLNKPPKSWKLNKTQDGWICPFFSCPRCHSQELTWYRQDLEREQRENQKGNFGRHARLICPTSDCRYEVKDDRLLLTREQMLRQPPDILFTTTEMLNRRLSRTREHHLFGISPHHTSPRLVLLDEIHTYEGGHGAQTAYLLRRWQHARRQHHPDNLCIVGLSATLTGADAFFSKLTGVPINQVSYISPREEDLVEEGAEYNVVLKGDPVSGTSLLSTSVQTVMLLGRMHDPDNIPSEVTAFGKKIFAFTDKLDVINRWYHITVEAEQHNTLSQYRDYSEKQIDHERRRVIYQLGQDWSVCRNIGHDLATPLRIDLTSSQYRGVNAQANFVLATSTLEVGFNDPDVGMIIQHKAPRSIASFLQRKGRAGRQRQIRPWMVVVTSAYGRDRWAFQHTEQLFNPQLNAINLPLENYYVRKIQATYTLMDWLAQTVRKEREQLDLDIWDALSSDDQGKDGHLHLPRHIIQTLLIELLRGQRLKDFQDYLQNALNLQDEMAACLLLWGEPRSLLFEVIPTVLRQLESNWQSFQKGKVVLWTDHISDNPMPDFVPPNLFSDLNLPELRLRLPEQPSPNRRTTATAPTMREDEFLPLVQALHEFAPGHVNKRYARKQYLNEAHWLEFPPEEKLKEGKIALQDLNIEMAELTRPIMLDGIEYRVYQPRTYSLSLVPKDVKNTSSGQLFWHTSFVPGQQNTIGIVSDIDASDQEFAPTHLELASRSPWQDIFSNIECYTQANSTWVEITRMAVGVSSETRYRGGRERKHRLTFEAQGQPAALGFTIYTDALRFEFPDLDVSQLRSHAEWPELYRSLSSEYLLHKLQHDLRLNNKLSQFEIDWLWQLELSMITAVAVARRCTLENAAHEVQGNRLSLAERALKVIFQSQQRETEDDDEKYGRLHTKLLDVITNVVVQAVLNEHDKVLWNRDEPQLASWLQQCYASSLGSLLFTALVQLLPDIDAENLIMDIEGNNIWISEVTGGGIGLISRIADAIALHPREFDLQMLDILQYCDREQLAEQLQTIAQMIENADPEVGSIFSLLRNGADLPRQLETRRMLTRTLEQRGIAPTRNLIVALNAKFLRPNSSADTDTLIATLVRYWHQEEQRLGCEIDLRVMAVAALRIPDIKTQVTHLLQRIGGPDAKVDESQVFNLLQSLLWLNCRNSCPDCIQIWQPYQTLVRPSRALLKVLVQTHAQTITYGSSEWKESLRQELIANYQAQLLCEPAQLEACKKDLLAMLTEPIDIGFQFYYPTVERLTLAEQRWIIALHIRELMYA